MRFFLFTFSIAILLMSCETTLEDRLRAQMIPQPKTQAEREKNEILEYAIDQQLEVQMTPSGLFYVIENPGEGDATVQTNSTVTFHYDCSHLNGFDCGSTRARGQATKLNLQSNGVIEGWKEVFPLLKKGGKGKFLIPSALAYGNKGAGNFYPPNTVIVYDIELLSFADKTALVKRQSDKEQKKIEAYIEKKGWQMQRLVSGIHYRIDDEGTGIKQPNLESTVKVKYKGALLDGFVFATSAPKGEAVELSKATAFWQHALPLMKKGGKATFIVPSSLGYGDREVGAIPANSVLVTEFELLDF